MANRMSMYSLASDGFGPRGAGQQSSQVSTTTLLNAVHNIYLSGQPYRLDAGTSLVVNTWLTATQAGPDGQVGGTVDSALAARAWEHARRRAEDGCIVLGSLHPSTPSVLTPFLASVPLNIPSSLFKALEAIQPFLRCATPNNPSTPRQVALGVTLTLNLAGNLTAASLALSQGGIDTEKGLLNIPAEQGYRAFDVFYYLLTSASTPAEREFLGLKAASDYALLSRSGTYNPPSYLPTADDGAAADDFRAALKEIGIKGSSHRNLISTLAGLLKLGNTVDYNVDEDVLEDVCEDVGGLLGMDPEVLATQSTTEDRQTFIAGLYEALVDWVIAKANAAIAAQLVRIRDGDESSDGGRGAHTPTTSEDNGDTVCITVLEIPDPALGKAVSMRGIFDDSTGINSEMRQDGIEVAATGSSVLREMQNAVSEAGPDLGITTGPVARDREHALERREAVLEKMGYAAENDGFLKKLLFPVEGEGINLGRAGRLALPTVLSSSRVWYHLCVHPTDESPASLAALPSVTSAWSAGTVSRQLRAWRLPEWANRRNKNLDFTADFDVDEFVQRYAALGCKDGRDGIESWILERGWSNGEVVVGNERVWMRESAWWEAESMLDLKPMQDAAAHMSQANLPGMGNLLVHQGGLESGYSNNGSGYFPSAAMGGGMNELTPTGSREGLLNPLHNRNQSQVTLGPSPLAGGAPSVAPSGMRNVSKGDYGLGIKGDDTRNDSYYDADGNLVYGLDPELADGKKIETKKMDFSRWIWVAFVWALTFWIPSPLLRWVGRMKRPDVRMAWREKLVIFFLIALINGMIIFWIIWFGKLLCPNFDKAYTRTEISNHKGRDDFWVSIHGKVYDISKFWKTDHSDVQGLVINDDSMLPLAGYDLSQMFQDKWDVNCPGLEKGAAANSSWDPSTYMISYNITEEPLLNVLNVHNFGTKGITKTPYITSKLYNDNWYNERFLPGIKEYYQGDLVWADWYIKQWGSDNSQPWFVYDGKLYDIQDYLFTMKRLSNAPSSIFLNEKLVDLIKKDRGADLTQPIKDLIRKTTDEAEKAHISNSLNCIRNAFYQGIPDFRYTPRCQVNNYLLLAFAIIICLVIGIKFLAALQFGSKRRPAPQDKFVICQVPAYTEGEDSLRKALDSLTALQYDNKRKLICVICDGIAIGAGNDRPTPKIVLDILGVDPKVDPPALPFKSVGEGSDQLNYGKVYSGLYEFEGNVVPYVVVVKMGKESEQTRAKPGNRGKRDSQILLMSFLNRVHHRSAMNPLELEMFHQINNVIGVDPELYEYLLMVDADTCVREDSLNRLVAKCAGDAKIAGICGETSLQNEERSWWTMIQVYEYYISHNLAKSFESLFGSVTCLPGCFSMYRLRTADKGKPLIISDGVIREYSDGNVDTLHKKNLLSLGEDRYLTTLMTKHFPSMSYKFIPDAYCQTAAPESFSVLLSQRRRWINSTVHNLQELLWLKELCGFCCFSMRFVVFIDLAGTIILPSTCVYIGYLIYTLATKTGPFPTITLAMLAAVYGLQALIFILKRQWQHIGWMIIYLLAFPFYSFVLPIYSFWYMDNFTWGNTRIVVGETGKKQIIAVADEGFDPRSIPLRRWDDYALANNLPGRRGGGAGAGLGQAEKMQQYHDAPGGYEMDDMKSVYSSVRQGSILTGMQQRGAYMPPQSPALPRGPGMMSRTSTMQLAPPYSDNPLQHRQSMVSMGGGPGPDIARMNSPYQDARSHTPRASTMMGYSGGARSPMGLGDAAHHASTASFDFQRGNVGPDDLMIVEAIQGVLREVDLDTVTKKQVRALVEQRLQTQLVGERRTFMDRQIDSELANM